MNNQDEQQFANKISQVLNQSTDNLSPGIRTRLQAARQEALVHQKTQLTGLSLAGVGHFTSDVILPQVRKLVALLALAVGVVGTYYWNSFQQAAENEEIDSALLSDELPINAYLDHGFSAWLEHSSQSSPE
ncbi:MAG: DUF3619 family protein [Betaproteobacteria bacterium]|nr:DUF3619 family protein [Betaproteobacteria bacterium]